MAVLPDTVQRFLARNIDALEQLEILLLLRSRRAGPLSPAEVTAELRLGAGCEQHLEQLRARGLLEAADDPPRYRYDAPSHLDAEVEQVADCYARYRVAVISCIFSPRKDDAILGFAEAFNLRRK